MFRQKFHQALANLCEHLWGMPSLSAGSEQPTRASACLLALVFSTLHDGVHDPSRTEKASLSEVWCQYEAVIAQQMKRLIHALEDYSMTVDRTSRPG